MAGANLLTLLDDISTLLDDVATMTKIATQKTVAVLGDDLAVNAEQIIGASAARELPIIWAVLKGSLVNKAILVPTALLISAFAPSLINIFLALGGLYLCYEGAEKVLVHDRVDRKEKTEKLRTLSIDEMKALEATRVKGAIKTDFVLSIEIIVIALGAMAHYALAEQVVALTVVAIVLTFGVYGAVAGIVKLDDLGLWMTQHSKGVGIKIGSWLVVAAPKLMKLLAIVGTIAMFIVGGGILAHVLPHGWLLPLTTLVEDAPHYSQWVLPLLGHVVLGFVVGAALLLLTKTARLIRGGHQ